MNIDISLEGKLAGYYRLQVLNADGECKKDTGWFKNLITDTGMDQFGSSVNEYNCPGFSTCVVSRCGVGTGNTPPATTDTALAAPLAMYPLAANASYSESNYTTTYVPGPPAYYRNIAVFSFPLGGVVGNVAEVGVGGVTSGALTTPILTTRALIVDSMGTPTTISVTSSDQLVVSFELRYYVDLTDTPYSVVISGITYTGNIRRSDVNVSSNFLPMLQIDRTSTSTSARLSGIVYNGTIGATTSSPSGTGVTIPVSVATAYTPGTYFKTHTFSANISQGNVSGGITAIRILSVHGPWQLSVSPALPKDATKVMTLVFNVSWARYP